MVRFLVIRNYPTGKRCWIFNQRLHHGTTGVVAALLFLTLKKPFLALAALGLVVHDRKDWRCWFIRECLPGD